MWSRSSLFVGVLVAVGIGVWVGVTTDGTAATPWIKVTTGVVMMLVGATLLLSRDARDRRHAQLSGTAFLLLGASQLMPPGRWRMAVSLVALGCMIAALMRRRRRAAGLPSSAG